MAHPAWLGDAWALAVVVVGGYCAGRLVAAVVLGRRTHVDLDVGHVLMAVAMAGMFVARWRTLPDSVWDGTFGVGALWCAGRAAAAVALGRASPDGRAGPHARHYAVHGVMAAAMVYMDAVSPAHPAAGARPTMTMGVGAGIPSLTLLFLLVLLASAVWQLNGIDQLVTAATLSPAGALPGGSRAGALRSAPLASASERPWLAPRLEVGSHVVMCLAMAYMLVLVV